MRKASKDCVADEIKTYVFYCVIIVVSGWTKRNKGHEAERTRNHEGIC